jgi:hypothetical protein
MTVGWILSRWFQPYERWDQVQFDPKGLFDALTLAHGSPAQAGRSSA